jgi:diketogulonate reductase-like aldo/keto reductase
MQMPRILYGTAWKRTDTAALVRQALAAGFRGIDTACQPRHYHEPGVGEGVAASLGMGMSRADLYLQTKFTPLSGHDPQRVPYSPDAPLAEQIEQSFAASLRHLRTDYLDCLLLHSPLPTAARTLAAWRALEAIVERGGTRRIGISNCYDIERLKALWRDARVKPAVVQNRFHAETGYDREIRAFCTEHGIVYQSFWTLTANPLLLVDDAIRDAAQRHGRTPEQVLFRYLTQQGAVPLTGTRSLAHMQEDLAIFEFALGSAELAAIDALLDRG